MKRLEELVRTSIQQVKPYSSARSEYEGSDELFLDANENPYGTLNRYPDPGQKKLKSLLSSLKNMPVESVFIGNGSDEIIDLTFRIFCEPGKDKALTFSPTYGMYEVCAAINQVSLIQVPLNEHFQFDPQQVKLYLQDDSIKVILICSPNNPTGNTMNGIEFLLNTFNGIVLVDEAYIDFSEHPSLLILVSKYPNLVVCQTLSKAYGLAAVRVGIAYAHEALIAWYNRIKPPYNISSLNQQAAIEALENTPAIQAQMRELIVERIKLKNALQEMPCVEQVYPSDANFLLVSVTDADDVYQKLVAQKIIVRNRNAMIKNCLRITVGSRDENKKLIEVLKSI